MSHELTRLSARLFNAPLLVLPETAEMIAQNLGERFAAGASPLQLRLPGGDDDPDGEPYTVERGVATIAVHGELVNRGSWLNSMSGLTSYEALQDALRQAAADPRVMSVILDMDSPGGEAAGAMETADEVRALSQLKSVTAYVNSLAASAGYAIAAGAKEIVVPPSGSVGSIGVVWMHLDRSQQMKDRGVKPTLLTAGKFKADGHSLGPLEDDARERIQSAIDDTYGLFVASVGKHRPKLGAEGARATEAAIYMGQKAVDAGLADRVGTLSSLFKERRSSRFGDVSLSTESNAAQAGVVDVGALASTPTEPNQPDAEEMAAMADAQAVEAAITNGAQSMQARIKAIMTSPAAKDRQNLAAHFAYDTAMSAEDALAALGKAGPETPAAATTSRMDGVPRLGVVTADGGAPADQRDQQQDDDAMHASIVEKLNATLPAQYRPRASR